MTSKTARATEALRVAVLWTGVAILTMVIHELGHWLAGTLLGNQMTMSLNKVGATGGYAAPWHSPVVTAAGPLVTVAQAIVAYAYLRWSGGRGAYLFLLAAFACRGMALIMNVFHVNDEGRLSEMLGLDVYVVPALTCAGLLGLVVAGSRAEGYGWKRVAWSAVIMVHLIGAVVLIDQVFTIRLL